MSAPAPAPNGSGSRSTSPVPPSTSATAATTDDWRKSVPQSYRSEEVRAVAKVLASLEPNTLSSSKMMLAMRFEDTIFQSASSLNDYRKRLTKRLKKVQKSYKPPAEGNAADEKVNAAEANKKKEEEMEQALREQFGSKLLFITQHAADAIYIMKEKHGSQRAEFLKQHTDNAEQWAVEIGLPLPPGTPKRRKRIPRDPGYLDRLKSHLEQRVDNIRSHVVKMTQPDLFIGETLVKLEEDMDGLTAETLAKGTMEALKEAQKDSNTTTNMKDNDVETTKALLSKALTPITTPPLTQTRLRSKTYQEHNKSIREAAIAHVSKIKAASNALISYMALDAKGKLEVKSCLKSSHDVAVESLKLLDEICRKVESQLEEDEAADRDYYKSSNAEGGGKKKRKMIKLEDAWNKIMDYKSTQDGGGEEEVVDIETDTVTSTDANNSTDKKEDDDKANLQPPNAKRLKTSNGTNPSSSPHLPHIVIRSQVLLTPNRKPPTSLLSALKMKHAELLPNKNMIQMKFGDAFEMMIHFVPLLVTIRASSSSSVAATADDKEKKEGSSNIFRKTIANGGLHTFTPPRRYLRSYQNRRRAAATTAQLHTSASRSYSKPIPTAPHQLLPLSVVGISGTSTTIGPMIASKLQYASYQATFVLRRIFASVAGKCYHTTTSSDAGEGVPLKRKSDFEIEIAEATALLQFLQLARDTYLPGLEEEDS
mmetsp:Transcript_10825/g.16110  ORF Transcript_10825/g.16110 Transcript_10825/m.16110 type:complete len:708 (-) Transcript_10825:276-2399(-)